MRAARDYGVFRGAAAVLPVPCANLPERNESAATACILCIRTHGLCSAKCA